MGARTTLQPIHPNAAKTYAPVPNVRVSSLFLCIRSKNQPALSVIHSPDKRKQRTRISTPIEFQDYTQDTQRKIGKLKLCTHSSVSRRCQVCKLYWQQS